MLERARGLVVAGALLGCGREEPIDTQHEFDASTDASATTSTSSATSISSSGASDDDEASTGGIGSSSSSGGDTPGAATVWEQFIEREGSWVSVCDVAFARDGSFALSAAVVPMDPGPVLSGFVAWFAPDGSIIREVERPDSILTGIAFDAGGGLFGVGNGQNPYSPVHGGPDDETTWGVWLRLDADGEVAWEIDDPTRSAGTDSCGRPSADERGSIAAHDDSATIYRYNAPTDASPIGQEVLRIDGDGTVAWSTVFARNPALGGSGAAFVGDTAFVAGNVETGLRTPEVTAWLSRVDADGSVAWERDVADLESISVVANEDALYWLVAEYGVVVAAPDTTVMRIDPESGATLWESVLPFRNDFGRADVVVRDADLFAAVAEVDPGVATYPALERHPADGRAYATLPLATDVALLLPSVIFSGLGEDFILAGSGANAADRIGRLWLARVMLL